MNNLGLRPDESIEGRVTAVATALRARFGDEAVAVQTTAADLTYVQYGVDGGPRFYRVAYAITSDGAITFGEREEVREEREFVPVSAAEIGRQLADLHAQLSEGAASRAHVAAELDDRLDAALWATALENARAAGVTPVRMERPKRPIPPLPQRLEDELYPLDALVRRNAAERAQIEASRPLSPDEQIDRNVAENLKLMGIMDAATNK